MRKVPSSYGRRPTATRAQSAGSRFVRHSWARAGKTLRCDRSPVAPNRTATWGSGTRSRRRPSRSGLASAWWLGRRRLPSLARRSSRMVRGAGMAIGAFVLIARRAASLRLHGMAAELVAKRGEDLGAVGVVLAGAEAGLQRERYDGRRDVAIDRLLDRPAALARVGDPALEMLEI